MCAGIPLVVQPRMRLGLKVAENFDKKIINFKDDV